MRMMIEITHKQKCLMAAETGPALQRFLLLNNGRLAKASFQTQLKPTKTAA